jgi:hypothetical protein
MVSFSGSVWKQAVKNITSATKIKRFLYQIIASSFLLSLQFNFLEMKAHACFQIEPYKASAFKG